MKCVLIIVVLLAISVHEMAAQITTTSYNYKDFQISNSYLYGVNFNSKKFQILSLAVPTSPSLYGQLTTNLYPFRVVVSGRYAFYLDTNYISGSGNSIDNSYSYGNLNAVDVSYPTIPNIIWTSTTSFTNAHSLAVAGNMVFVSASLLYVYNFSIPNAPVLATTFSYNPGEITAKMITSDIYIVLTADKDFLYSYKVYRSGSSVYYSVADYYNNKARDVFLSGNNVYAVANYNIFGYTISDNGTLNSNYNGYSVLKNAINSIIYDNVTNRLFANYQAYVSGIVELSTTTNNPCTYNVNYQTDIISFFNHYFFATQIDATLLVIDRNALTCTYNSNSNAFTYESSYAIGIIIGIACGVIFFIFLIACIICLFVRQYRRENAYIYKSLVDQPLTDPMQLYPPQAYPPGYSVQPYPTQQQFYPQVNPPEYTPPIIEQKK